MLFIVFIAFFALIAAWLVAPTGEVAPAARTEPMPSAAPTLARGEATA